MEKARILIVEDESIIAMETESNLQSLGYEVTSIVNTGKKAIEKAEQDKPDLVIMDIRINGEMDGIDTAKEIRNRFGIPIIFATAYLDQSRIERAKITMPFGYLLKPIQERDLKVTLEMALYVAKVDKERQQIALELEKSNEKYQLLADNTIDCIWLMNLDTVFTYVNPAIQNLIGFTPEEWIGTKLATHVDEVNFNLMSNMIEKAIEDGPKGTGKVFECTLKNKDGQNVPVEIWGKVIWQDNKPIALQGATRDITDRKKIESALKESEEKYRKLFEDSIDGYALADTETGIILECNQALADMVERTKEEIIGQHQSILHPDSAVVDGNSISFRKANTENIEGMLRDRFVTKNGKEFDVSTRGRKFKSGDRYLIHATFRTIED